MTLASAKNKSAYVFASRVCSKLFLCHMLGCMHGTSWIFKLSNKGRRHDVYLSYKYLFIFDLDTALKEIMSIGNST